MSATVFRNNANGFEKKHLQKTDESELLKAAEGGDGCAFTELTCRHSTRVYRTVLSITNNTEDAEDALQNTLLSAYKNPNVLMKGRVFPRD